jgi:hypothetical protein
MTPTVCLCLPQRIQSYASRSCQTPCLPFFFNPPTQNSLAVIPRTFPPAPSSCCQCLFHITPPRCMLTSRPVTHTRLSLKIAQSLNCLISIAYLDLAVAPPHLSAQNTNTGLCLVYSIVRRRGLF